MFNFLLRLLYYPVQAWYNWADKQQRIYEYYRATAPTREVLVRYKLAVQACKEELRTNIHYAKLAEKRPLK